MRRFFVVIALAWTATAHGVIGKWIDAGTMIRPRMNHTAILLRDGRVLIVGGVDANGLVLLAETFDPTTNTFRPAGILQHGQYKPTAFLLSDGSVLVAGSGYVERYQPELNAFVDALETGTSTVGTLDGSPLLCRGCAGGCQFYRPPDLITAQLAINSAGDAGVAALRDGSLLVAYGTVCDVYVPYSTNTAFRIDRAEKQHDVPTPDDPFGGRSRATAVAYDLNHVLIAGGTYLPSRYCQSHCQSIAYASTRIYDFAIDTISAGPPMQFARTSHIAQRLTDGRVLVAGGDNLVTALASAEIFDPSQGAFVRIADMPAPRTNAASVLLSDGRVFVAGGTPGTTADLHPNALILDPTVARRQRTVRH